MLQGKAFGQKVWFLHACGVKNCQRTIILQINIQCFFIEFILWVGNQEITPFGGGGDFNGLALYLLLQGLVCIMLYWVVTRVLPVYFSGPNRQI